MHYHFLFIYFTWLSHAVQYCRPGQKCWPTTADIAALESRITNQIIEPGNGVPAYRMKNPAVQTYPSFVAFVVSNNDVVECVKFVRAHNLQLTILSSGHSYTGRSSANFSFQINFSTWKSITFSPSNDAVTVTTGNTWKDVYVAVDQKNRVIVGGSCPTVTPGGYTMGGGHSAIAPLHGLASDNVVEFQVVTAEAKLITVNRKSYSDLFWALRGGGGSTFGIVTHITFQTHAPPPNGWTELVVSYNASIFAEHGLEILSYYNKMARSFDKRWGGYLVASEKGMLIATLFAGNVSEASAILAPFAFHPEWDAVAELVPFATFWDYQMNIVDPLYVRTALLSVLVNESTSISDEYGKTMIDLFDTTAKTFGGQASASCTIVHVGRTVSDFPVDSSAVSPAFRNARFSVTCGVGWPRDDMNKEMQKYSEVAAQKLYRLSNGSYYSETNAATSDWPDRFWGKDHYDTLVKIKRKYDRSNVFSCPQCVKA